MATIKFYCRSKIHKLVPVYIRFSDGREIDIRLMTPFRIFPHYWNEKKQALNSSALFSKELTRNEAKDIEDKFTQLKDAILRELFKLSGPASKEWLEPIIHKLYFNEIARVESLNQYINRFLEEATSGQRLCFSGTTKKAYSDGTLRSIRDFQRSFNLFQGIYSDKKSKRKSKEEPKRSYKPLNFDNITIDFYNDFTQFFYDRNCGANYVGKHIKTLKALMRQAKDEGLHNNSEYERKSFRAISEEVDNIYLTEEEIETLFKMNLSENKPHEIARDVFLVGVYTAQRYSDYGRITKDNIRSYGGNKVIELYQQKTGEKCIIPVRPELDKILKRYKYNLPKTHEQKINKYIKEIGREAKIDEVVRQEQNKGGLMVKKKAFKYELIKTHTARRTGCTLMYLAGIPVIDIMKISGHKTEKEFLKYIKVTKEQTAVNLASHPYFKGIALKVVQ